MALAPGTRLGPYEILDPLGAGGMGDVYRARDTRLDRTVAIKVLPSHLSSNLDLRARFEREAKAISTLNHPNICTLHDIGHQDGIDYLVMELVEGETLALRLGRGPLAIEEVLREGGRIADALEKAHRGGIIHRDLKPGNVMLTKSGAKLMDFGLARAAGAPAAGGSAAPAATTPTQSPTLAQPLTAQGSLLGTFQYMAPEQLEGREADARSDIWALGCVLYEMATGRRAFEGASQASLIAAIMEKAPRPVTEIAPMSPPAFDRLVRQCLAKDPEDRIQTAHDVRLQLESIAEARAEAAAPSVADGGRSREKLAWGVAAVASLAAITIASWALFRQAEPARRIVASISPPRGAALSVGSGPMALSPDGRRIAFSARGADGKYLLWARALDEAQAVPLPGTEEASCPFWSPDGRSVGFFAKGSLKRIDLDGRLPEVLAPARRCFGGTWGPDGTILFVGERDSPILRISATGGQTTVVIDIGDKQLERMSYAWPSFLPDGRRFLYTTTSTTEGSREMGIFVGSLDSKEGRRLLPVLSNATYAAPGYLLYAKDGSLRAQPFDAARLELRGEPKTLAEEVQ